jgi:hypothetical protein
MTSADATGREEYPNGAGSDDDRLDLHESQIAGSFADPAASLDEHEVAGQVDETEQLPLGDDDVRLPWLQSDDDDEDDYEGYSAGQMISLVLLGLLALGVIVGGLWWATRPAKDDVLVADGGVIEAPEQPYKQRPANPGGKTFDGTGDTSFAVSEGQTRPARLGQSAPVKPSVDVTPKPAVSGAPAARPTAAAPVADVPGIGVQVAAYSTRAAAEAGWTRLSGQYSALSPLHHRIVEGRADIGTVYRLQAVTADTATANTLCRGLKSSGLACQVKN